MGKNKEVNLGGSPAGPLRDAVHVPVIACQSALPIAGSHASGVWKAKPITNWMDEMKVVVRQPVVDPKSQRVEVVVEMHRSLYNRIGSENIARAISNAIPNDDRF